MVLKINTQVLRNLNFIVNLLSADEHGNVLQEKLDKEVCEGRMGGPFLSFPIAQPTYFFNRVVPKADGANKQTMLQSTVLTLILTLHFTFKCTSFDTVIQTVGNLGQGTKLAKIDIKKAFCLLRFNFGDFNLVLQGAHFIDKCLPYRYFVSCKIFEKFAVFLEWAIKQRTGLDTVHHYLDDFIFAGGANNHHCNHLMTALKPCVENFGYLLIGKKHKYPQHVQYFLA